VSELEGGVACTGKDGGGAQHHPIISYAGDIYTLFLTAHITKNATTKKKYHDGGTTTWFQPSGGSMRTNKTKQRKTTFFYRTYTTCLFFVFIFF
jgi:hypothetical protein